jgi:hypothetical protein
MQSFLKGRDCFSSKSFFIVLLTEVPQAWDRPASIGMDAIEQAPSGQNGDGENGYSRKTTGAVAATPSGSDMTLKVEEG